MTEGIPRYGEQPLAQTVAAAGALRRLTELLLSLEHEHPTVDAMLAQFADWERELAPAVPPDLTPRIGDGGEEKRVYLDHAFDVGGDGTTWAKTPWAPQQLDLRFTVSGPIPKIKGLSYRLIADYAVAPRGPYVVGPVSTPLPTDNVAQLIPVDQFRASVGLQYDIR